MFSEMKSILLSWDAILASAFVGYKAELLQLWVVKNNYKLNMRSELRNI